MLPQGVTTLRIPECAVQECAVPNKAIMKLLAVFQPNLIIINHPHGPSLASNVQKNGPQIFNETRQVRTGGLTSFDKLSIPLDYLHYMFHHRHSFIEQ